MNSPIVRHCLSYNLNSLSTYSKSTLVKVEYTQITTQAEMVTLKCGLYCLISYLMYVGQAPVQTIAVVTHDGFAGIGVSGTF